MEHGKKNLSEREYRERLRLAQELLELFKRAAYLAHEI
jgi:hypothetical protein